jgi:hypothetical protein
MVRPVQSGKSPCDGGASRSRPSEDAGQTWPVSVARGQRPSADLSPNLFGVMLWLGAGPDRRGDGDGDLVSAETTVLLHMRQVIAYIGVVQWRVTHAGGLTLSERMMAR